MRVFNKDLEISLCKKHKYFAKLQLFFNSHFIDPVFLVDKFPLIKLNFIHFILKIIFFRIILRLLLTN